MLKTNCVPSGRAPMTLSEIVADYIREHRDNARAEMRFFEIQRGATQAIQKAALCVLPSGKRNPHQRRIPRALLELVEVRLQEVQWQLKRAETFDDLHRAIAQQIGSIKGVGTLTVYDVSHRIGAYFGKHPNLVYLHAGTRKAAMAFGITGASFDPNVLPGDSDGFSRTRSKTASACTKTSWVRIEMSTLLTEASARNLDKQGVVES